MELIYNAEQLSAIEKASDFIINGNPDEYYLIEGKAGTGKTTVIKEVLKQFRNRHIIGCALSHKAKNVLRKSISSANINAEYFSVAGMLNMVLDLETGVFKKIYVQGKNKVPPIQKADIIIVDEASMINEETIEYIFSEKKYTCKVIFLGDIGQLPPIRTLENNYYLNWNPEDLNKISPVFENKNKSKLLIRVRQGEESPILPFADYFWNNSQNKRPQEYPVSSENRKSVITDNGALLFVNKTNEIFDKLLDLYNIAVKNNKPNLLKFISYRNKTRITINKYIHKHFFKDNPNQYQPGELIIFKDNYNDIENSTEAQVVDKTEVITDKNGIKYYNLILSIEGFDKFQQIPIIFKESVELHNEIIKSKFDQAKNYLHKVGRNKKYYELLSIAWKEKDKYPNIDLSYAVSSHTSQGSTYDICVVHEQDINSVSMIDAKQKSQSIYTAITRAKNICIVISDQNVDNSNIDFKNLNLIELNNKYNGNV
jgi:hypothetical protein